MCSLLHSRYYQTNFDFNYEFRSLFAKGIQRLLKKLFKDNIGIKTEYSFIPHTQIGRHLNGASHGITTHTHIQHKDDEIKDNKPNQTGNKVSKNIDKKRASKIVK